MRVIAIEEHYAHPALQSPAALANLRKHPQLSRIQDKLQDVGAGRIADMDSAGIDLQVLSHTVPGAEAVEPVRAITAARTANDDLAETVAAHPDRFAGFAALPMRDPVAAALELERAVNELGFRWAMVNGLVDGRFLDDPAFLPVLEKAAEWVCRCISIRRFRRRAWRARTTADWNQCWQTTWSPPVGAGIRKRGYAFSGSW